jgi:nucleoside-diphosphate-sugar epimerase/acetyltransferase-like isoleucine patch superfamily enzyme
MNKNILVTGGAGFFGSKLVEKLLQLNYNVTVYDILSFGDDGCKPFYDKENFKLIIGDIREQSKLETIIFEHDVIIHLAAYVGEPVCKKNKDNVYEVNTESTYFIADICKKHNKQLVFLSTCSNYGKNTELVNEESTLNPLGLYSDTKIKAEKYIINNLDNYLILRCSTLFGVSHRMRVDLTINQFLFEIFNYGVISVFGEAAWRPYIHVEDASNIIIKSFENKLTGVYNLGKDSLNITKKQIVDELNKHNLNFKTEYVHFDDPRDYRVDFKKLNSSLDYDIKFDFSSGIKEMIEYFQNSKDSMNNPPIISMKIGYDVKIDEDVIFKQEDLVSIGNHVAIDKGFYCTTSIEIGDYVHISPYVTCIGGKDGKFISKGFNNIMAGARIICSSDRFDGTGLFGAMIPKELKGQQITEVVVMEEFSNIGTNSIVLPGSILRRGVLLSAGSLLIGDTEEWGVYKGNPAVLVKKIDPTKILENAKKLGWQE